MKNLLNNQITIVKNAVEHLEIFTSNLENYETRIAELEKENEELKQEVYKLESNNFKPIDHVLNVFKDYFKEVYSEFDFHDITSDLEEKIDLDIEHYGKSIEFDTSLSAYDVELSFKESFETILEQAEEKFKQFFEDNTGEFTEEEVTEEEETEE